MPPAATPQPLLLGWAPGWPELLLILFIVLLIFGTGKIADLGRGLGEGIRNFKKGLKNDGEGESRPPESGKKQ